MAVPRELSENVQTSKNKKVETQNMEEIYKKALMKVIEQNEALKAKLDEKDKQI